VNQTRICRRALGDLWRIDSHRDYHRALFDEGLHRYLRLAKRRGHAPGAMLVVGAGVREARALARHPFDRVVLSNVAEPDDAVREAVEQDPRLCFEIANAECLPYDSGSFDAVLCKETLHHLPRPVLGLYELLRVCRRATVFVEPWDCALGRMLDRFGLATRYERNQPSNAGGRSNYVYRWSRRSLENLLRSLYLESGFTLDVSVGWASSRALVRRGRVARRAAAFAGWAASHAPGARGNLATVLVAPGASAPPDAKRSEVLRLAEPVHRPEAVMR
jgi:SAM-dependent methyltransferase